MKELRDFYHAHYYARNMRLVVLAGYELDEIQRRVVEHFKDVPAGPRVSYPEDRAMDVTNLRPYGLPFRPDSLLKVYRILPVRDRHILTMTWQIPPVGPHWRTAPADYLAHLLGHEASGSILSALRERGWATSLSAGVGEDGTGDASTHALFSVSLSLSKRGMGCWEENVETVFAYIGMLRLYFLEGHLDHDGHKREGLPPIIYDELKCIAEMSYRYADEGDAEDIVEDIAENMAPWYNLPAERVLDGDSLLFGDSVDNEAVKSLLFDYFTPANTRIDLMSSLFGRDGDFDSEGAGEEEKKEESETDAPAEHISTDLGSPCEDNTQPSLFDMERAGPPSIEPRFGSKFWVEDISEDVIQRWTSAADSHLSVPSELKIGLPPKNDFIPKRFDVKPSDDAEHPLLNCSVKVCVSVGKTKSWFPACVTKYRTDNESHHLALSYEDEGEKWHMLDSPKSYTKYEGEEALEVGLEGTFDNFKVKFRVTAIPRDGEGIVFSFGDSGHDDDVEDGTAFPPIPPPSSRLPTLICDKQSVKMWHLQDRKFKRPLADLRIKFECAGMNDSALNQACMSLFCKLCADALTETCYLASVCELDSSIYPTETGLSICVHGFDDNLLVLAKEVLAVVMSFRGRDGESDLPTTIKEGRFDACLEVLRRRYTNAGMDASSFSSSLRLLCLMPSVKSSFSKHQAMQGITAGKFVQVMSALLKRVSVEAFYHGNVTRADASEASNLIFEALTDQHIGLPKKKLPSKLVLKTKHACENHTICTPTIDPKDANTAVEVYFQIGKDDNSSHGIYQRVLTDLMEQILEEPLYNQLRTKDGVLGMSFRVVTTCKSAEESSARIDEFLKVFRSELEEMDDATFFEHVVSLARNKLESFDSMEEETSSHWSEIVEGRYDFEAFRKECHCLKSITKDALLAAYDEHLHPLCTKGKPKKRRRMVLHVIGSGEGRSSDGRPVIENEAVGDEIDRLVQQFHASVKRETWGRIAFNSPELRRTITV
ncbi:hypothetical protein ACHAWF_012904 [Thalassiosira exigua]